MTRLRLPFNCILIALAALGGCAFFAGCQSTAAVGQVNLAAGYREYQLHDYAAAHNTATAFIQADSTSPNIDEAYYLAGLAQEAQGHVPAAKTDYMAAIAHSSRPQVISKSSAALGDIAYARGRFASAITYYQRAATADPAVGLPISGLMQLGISQQNVGDWAAANTTFSAIEQSAPGTTAALIARQRFGQTHFAIQYGAYSLSTAAWNQVRVLRSNGIYAVVVTQNLHNRPMYLVQSGFFPTFKVAMAARTAVAARQPQAIVVP